MVSRGQHQDRGVVLRLFAKLAADRNAVLTGQHQVQDNEIETFVDREFEAVRAAVGEIEFVPLAPKY